MSKIAWIDVETGGLSAIKNPVLQIALLLEVDGKVIDKFTSYIQPLPQDVVDQEALDVNGITREQIETFPSPLIVIRQLVNFLNLHVNKYDRTDKMVIAGYNVDFDDKFLRAWFKKLNEKYYGSFFFWRRICVLNESVHYIVRKNLALPRGLKLAEAAEMFDVKVGKLHDALADITLTRNIYHEIGKRLFGDTYIFEEYPKPGAEIVEKDTVLHDATQSTNILERLKRNE